MRLFFWSSAAKTHDGRADMTNFEMDLFDTRMSHVNKEKEEDTCCSSSRNRIIKPACLPISIVALLIILLVFLPLFNDDDLEVPDKFTIVNSCMSSCSVELVETIPTNLTYETGPRHRETWQVWKELLDNSERFVDIAQMYWNLNSTEYPTASNGRAVYDSLMWAGKRNVKVRIAQNIPSQLSTQSETKWLADEGLAMVRSLNFTALLGAGILHTKFMVVDMKHVYIGSANADWKSLSEVKEMGMLMRDCPCMATDLFRVFAVYWRLGKEDAKIPAQWPISYRTPYNAEKPMKVEFNGIPMEGYISSSPGPFNPKGREHDLNAILKTIRSAKREVSVAVMDYVPQMLYLGSNNSFWPIIDDALRDAAFRGVHVRLLVSKWNSTKPVMFDYLRSLMALNPVFPTKSGNRGHIEVKVFVVPASEEQKKIPFARVNHNKYMVTDDTAYIGTSNWSGDYFTDTAGVALVARRAASEPHGRRSGQSIVDELRDVFNRDWNSDYATTMEEIDILVA